MRVTLIFDGNHFYRNLETAAPHRVIDYDRLAHHCLSLISPNAMLNAAHYYTPSGYQQLQHFQMAWRVVLAISSTRSAESTNTQIAADMVRMVMDAFDVWYCYLRTQRFNQP